MSTETMSSRERLLAAYRSLPVDRVPIRVWNAMPWTEVWHPSFQPILDAALAKTDIVGSWDMESGYFLTDRSVVEMREEDHPGNHEGFRERHSIVETSAGPIRTIRAYTGNHPLTGILCHCQHRCSRIMLISTSLPRRGR